MARFVFLVLDGVGVGALPDASDYGDAGADTLGNVSRIVPLRLPFLQRMGLGNILPVAGVPPVDEPIGLAGRLRPLSAGKDTTVGHWEHMGLVTARPFPTYPDGFPPEVIALFTKNIGRGILGNRPASGTVIIEELGEEHMATGKPIVYTSADSVFQIAAHVDVVPLDRLYAWCESARALLQGRHAVARVIARPFTGRPGAFVRTADRKDFSLAPPRPTYLDLLIGARVPVFALRKIAEVFVGRGVSTTLKVASNEENLRLVQELLGSRSTRAAFREGLLMTNLVDFDMLWGHRNDVEGFGRGLEAFDSALGSLVAELGPEDRLLITADHGVDPTTSSTDHSREYVPLLFYPRPAGAPQAVYEGMFADTGATAFAHLTGQDPTLEGRDIQRLDPKRGWRQYTPVRPTAAGALAGLPGRVGKEERDRAARHLGEALGQPPRVAVILGSGLDVALEGQKLAEVRYDAIPHWPVGAVPGHPQHMAVWESGGMRVALLHGRPHEYEGYDLSEVQSPVRSLAAWGVSSVILTTAAGAVTDGLAPGTLVLAGEVLDFQYPSGAGDPARLPATDRAVLSRITKRPGTNPPVRVGTHASVPGPQYETPAELRALAGLGVLSVSMSPAAELRAADDEGQRVAVVAVVTNAGDTSHAEVLASSRASTAALTAVVSAILSVWGL